jgi:hypothetical protein
VTATTRTTLRIIYDAQNPFNIRFDPPADNPVWTRTYTPPSTVTQTTPLTLTTAFSTTLTSTTTLPTKIITATTSSVNPACASDLSNYAAYAPQDESTENAGYFHLTANQQILVPAPAAGISPQAACCEAAYRLGGVGYWQVSYEDGSCWVMRAANDNTCSQAAHNYTGLTQVFSQPKTVASFTGNGVCGRFTSVKLYPV